MSQKWQEKSPVNSFLVTSRTPTQTPIIITHCSVYLSCKTMIHPSYSLCELFQSDFNNYNYKIPAPNTSNNVNGKIKVSIPTL